MRHLVGITDVAYVHNDINLERDKKIEQVAIEGTENIINSISKNCKLIFPSTHIVFEVLQEIKRDLKKDQSPYPVLAYAKSKLKNEKQIIEGIKNYVILRLSSIYGYLEDSMRMSIMHNLFAKIASIY